MIALMESSSPNFLSCWTTVFGSIMTPSRSTTPILSPKPPSAPRSPPACSVRYTSVKTASTKRKNAPPPMMIQSQVRERLLSAIDGHSIASFAFPVLWKWSYKWFWGGGLKSCPCQSTSFPQDTRNELFTLAVIELPAEGERLGFGSDRKYFNIPRS